MPMHPWCDTPSRSGRLERSTALGYVRSYRLTKTTGLQVFPVVGGSHPLERITCCYTNRGGGGWRVKSSVPSWRLLLVLSITLARLVVQGSGEPRSEKLAAARRLEPGHLKVHPSRTRSQSSAVGRPVGGP
jgi:hypothetical protein